MWSPKHWRVILLTAFSLPLMNTGSVRFNIPVSADERNILLLQTLGCCHPVAVSSRPCCFLGACSELTYYGWCCLRSGLTAAGLQLV